MAKRLIPERSVLSRRLPNGKEVYNGEVYADTWAELAGVTELDGVTLDSGSLAYTADGELCTLDSAGVWHKKDGGTIADSEAVTANA